MMGKARKRATQAIKAKLSEYKYSKYNQRGSQKFVQLERLYLGDENLKTFLTRTVTGDFQSEIFVATFPITFSTTYSKTSPKNLRNKLAFAKLMYR